MITSDDLFAEIYENNDVEPTEEVQNQDESTEHQDFEAEGGEEGEDGDKTVVKPKRIVRNPQPKLNEETLKGKRGLTALESYFDRIKYKGRGHEEQDLNMILKTYEYWCHRLFPKYPFDDCIAKIEKLGSKRAVQTHVKRIRMNLLNEDQINEEAPVANDDHEDNDEPLAQPEDEEEIEITDEQLERIRLNRERAERLRQERMRLTQSTSQQISQISTNITSPSISGDSQHAEQPSSSVEVQESKDATAEDQNRSRSPSPDAQPRSSRITKRRVLKSSSESSDEEAPEVNEGDENKDEPLVQAEDEEITDEQLEKIRLNREHVERLRHERLRLTQSPTQEISEISRNITSRSISGDSQHPEQPTSPMETQESEDAIAEDHNRSRSSSPDAQPSSLRTRRRRVLKSSSESSDDGAGTQDRDGAVAMD